MQEVFELVPGTTTRQVNAAVRAATAKFCEKWDIGVEPNERLDRGYGKRRYVFGIGNSMRGTHVASFVPGENSVMIVFPNNYKGWPTADVYTRLRVSIRDELVYRSGIVVRNPESL